MRNLILVFGLVVLVATVAGCKKKEGAACGLKSDCADDLTCTSPDDPTVPKVCMSRANATTACATGVTCTKWHKCKLDYTTGVCVP